MAKQPISTTHSHTLPRERNRIPIVCLDRDDPAYIKEMQRPAAIKVSLSFLPLLFLIKTFKEYFIHLFFLFLII